MDKISGCKEMSSLLSLNSDPAFGSCFQSSLRGWISFAVRYALLEKLYGSLLHLLNHSLLRNASVGKADEWL